MKKQNTYSKVTFKDYSEKAIKFAMAVEYANNNSFVKTFFAPKSLLKDGCLPDWFLGKKFDEICKPGMIGFDTKGSEDYSDDEQNLALVTNAELVAALA